MANPFTQALLEQHGKPVSMEPCEITQVTPLLISWRGADNVEALKAIGLTYTLGAALAFHTSPGQPLVVPIG